MQEVMVLLMDGPPVVALALVVWWETRAIRGILRDELRAVREALPGVCRIQAAS